MKAKHLIIGGVAVLALPCVCRQQAIGVRQFGLYQWRNPTGRRKLHIP